jgi:hypothetical protein
MSDVYSGEYNVYDVTLMLLWYYSEFDSHRGQVNFSAFPVRIYTQSNIKNNIFKWNN